MKDLLITGTPLFPADKEEIERLVAGEPEIKNEVLFEVKNELFVEINDSITLNFSAKPRPDNLCKAVRVRQAKGCCTVEPLFDSHECQCVPDHHLLDEERLHQLGRWMRIHNQYGYVTEHRKINRHKLIDKIQKGGAKVGFYGKRKAAVVAECKQARKPKNKRTKMQVIIY